MKKYIKIENFQKISILLFFYFTYFFNKKYYVQTIDYLNQAYVYKTIKRKYYNIFDIEKTIPNFLDGYKYNYLIPSEFHFTSITEYFFGVENSELFFQILGRILIIYVSVKIFNKFSQNNVAIYTAATFVGVSDFYPIITTSILAMVICVFVYLESKEELTFKNFSLLLVLPFLYEIQLGGIWIFALSTFIFIKEFIKTKKFKNIYFILLNLFFVIVNNYRLLYEIFFGEETVRTYTERKVFDLTKIGKLFKEFIKVNIEGHWHFSTSVKYFIFPVITLFFLYILIKLLVNRSISDDEKIFLFIYLIIQIFHFLYSMDRAGVFDLNSLFGLRINLWRIVIFNQLLNPLLFLLTLNKVKFKSIILIFFFASFMLNGAARAKITEPYTFSNSPTIFANILINFGQKINFIDYLLMTNWNNALPFLSTYGSPHMSIDDYYMVSSFDEYKSQTNDLNKLRFVSYNIDPMIAGYNDLRILDGYYNLYEKKYNIKFRKVIEKELEYLGPSGASYYDNFAAKVSLFIKVQNPSYNLDNINFCELTKSLGATHLISSKFINVDDFKNNKYIDLEFENKNLFIYKIKQPSNCL